MGVNPVVCGLLLRLIALIGKEPPDIIVCDQKFTSHVVDDERVLVPTVRARARDAHFAVTHRHVRVRRRVRVLLKK